MDDREFEKVFWVLQPQLMRHARLHLDPSAAEDAVSMTLLTLWGKSLPYPTDEVAERRLRSLAYVVLTGHIRNEHRSRRRRQSLVDRMTLITGTQHQPRTDASEGLLQRESIRYWLSKLRLADRMVITLFNEGFDTEEIAQILNCSVAAAAKRRTRARKRLRAIVDDERGRS